MDQGNAEFNHCLAARRPAIADGSSVIAFAGVVRQDSPALPRAPVVRILKPGIGTGFRFGRQHKITRYNAADDNLSLGPAFAHPIAFRPDGQLVVTWWRQAIDANGVMSGTTLGFTLMSVAGKFCPTDLNSNGNPNDQGDYDAFLALFNAGHPFTDWNQDNDLNVLDFTAFQQDAQQVGCQ